MSVTGSSSEPAPELHQRDIAAGPARVAVFRRTYSAPVEDVWDACTNPERLRRWYVPVTGDLRLGGTFEQAMMGSGLVMRCDPPRLLHVALGGGVDEIELHLAPADDGGTSLELEHATTLGSHEIDGQVFDAIFCMGGGYYPRLAALDRLLRDTLPSDYDTLTAHERPDTRDLIERGSSAMAALLAADARRSASRES